MHLIGQNQIKSIDLACQIHTDGASFNNLINLTSLQIVPCTLTFQNDGGHLYTEARGERWTQQTGAHYDSHN